MRSLPPRPADNGPKRRRAWHAPHPQFVVLHERQRELVVQSLLLPGRHGA
jgi:hypothetical protein